MRKSGGGGMSIKLPVHRRKSYSWGSLASTIGSDPDGCVEK